jgi:hypothetical protein
MENETITPEVSESTSVQPYTNPALNEESLDLLGKIIASTDEQQTRDLTYLFNLNQNKKTLVRMDKLSGLQDGLVDQFVKRIAERPDEISNKELMDGLRIVQDIIERGQRQTSGMDQQTPMIQINQQNTSVNIGDHETSLNRESRERVKNAVMGLLQGLAVQPATPVDFEDKTEDKE